MEILITEADPVSRRLLKTVVSSWGHQVTAAQNGVEAMELLISSDSLKLAILDWTTPGLSGLEICQRLRTLNKEEYVYVIALANEEQSQDILECMIAGADDYVTKPFKPGELEARIYAASRIVDLHAKFVKAQNKLRRQATHDFLTGLWNRSGILDILGKELHRSDRNGGSVAVLLADLDHFKLINDTHGQKVGDAVLREVAERIACKSRAYDYYGRYGGQEFLAVIPGCDVRDAETVARRIQRRICAKPVVCGDREITISMSIGVASLSNARPGDSDAIIQAADAALYQAKNEGRNCVRVAAYPKSVETAA